MTVAELIVRASIQVFQLDPATQMPVSFGSGCLVMYLGRTFFVSVSHVTDYNGLVTCLETNRPPDERGQILSPVGGICYFDQLKFKEGTSLQDFEALASTGKRLDIAFAELKDTIELLQPAIDFPAFRVEAGEKVRLYLDNAVLPHGEETYGFYGKIRLEYEGRVLRSTPTFKHSLKFHRQKDHMYMFLAPEIILDKADYEGCSGAPILDSEGGIVALACAVVTGKSSFVRYSSLIRIFMNSR